MISGDMDMILPGWYEGKLGNNNDTLKKKMKYEVRWKHRAIIMMDVDRQWAVDAGNPSSAGKHIALTVWFIVATDYQLNLDLA